MQGVTQRMIVRTVPLLPAVQGDAFSRDEIMAAAGRFYLLRHEPPLSSRR